jgi:hypothetical protein
MNLVVLIVKMVNLLLLVNVYNQVLLVKVDVVLGIRGRPFLLVPGVTLVKKNVLDAVRKVICLLGTQQDLPCHVHSIFHLLQNQM